MRPLLLLACLGLLGCDSKSDNADSVTGPGISVHCSAQTPLGDTTVKVDCPPQP